MPTCTLKLAVVSLSRPSMFIQVKMLQDKWALRCFSGRHSRQVSRVHSPSPPFLSDLIDNPGAIGLATGSTPWLPILRACCVAWVSERCSPWEKKRSATNANVANDSMVRIIQDPLTAWKRGTELPVPCCPEEPSPPRRRIMVDDTLSRASQHITDSSFQPRRTLVEMKLESRALPSDSFPNVSGPCSLVGRPAPESSLLVNHTPITDMRLPCSVSACPRHHLSRL